MTLSVKKIAKLTARGRYFDAHGLYLQVISPTNRSWLLRFELRGRKRWMGLGSAATFTLAEARERALAARKLLADKIDPLDARRTERAQLAAAAAKSRTFAQVASEFFDTHSVSWRNRKHHRDFLNSLRHAALLAAQPVATIDEALVLATLQPLWTTKTITAQRLQQRIKAIMDFAVAAGYRSAGPNPARWEHLRHLLPAPDKITNVRPMPALSYAELPVFMAELRAVLGVAARALEFTILTAARTNEVLGAQWSEIDLDAAQWTIPGERMKAGKLHRVPLSRQAVALLQALPREGEFVFVGAKAGRPVGNVAMYRVLRQLRSAITVHGFRSTFRTWAEERTSFPAVIAEEALAHTIGSAVQRAYRRTDLLEKRTRLMQQWAEFCDTPIVAGAVVPLRGNRL
jgi:integrase